VYSRSRAETSELDEELVRRSRQAEAMTALIGLIGVAVGVLLGGGVQLLVAWRERVGASRRAARLLFGDHLLALAAVRSLIEVEHWWSEDSAPPLSDWRRYREALAGAMEGTTFITVDGAFQRVSDLERWRRLGLSASDQKEEAIEARDQLYEVGGLLLTTGFSGREQKRMQTEMKNDESDAEREAAD
jgi:hypothetical protein